ncbi:MAG: hypothetical protein LBC59_04700 [Chitinispirillales bacterium]|jgi:hypothetical protein|nr:hypothetical protein [Chitinispirillales bacterium]
MNSAEKDFWGDPEAMAAFIRRARRPGEGPSGYDSRLSFEDAVAYAEVIGEAGETVLAELLKMKGASEVESKPNPEPAARELVAV